MKVLKRGHDYRLDHVDGEGHTDVAFVNKEPGQEKEGFTTQEVVRMLIDRTRYCNNCLPHWVNEQIIWHFRQIISLHEARALLQKTAKGELLPEFAATEKDGHFLIVPRAEIGPMEETKLLPPEPLGTFSCNHRSAE